MSDRYQAVVLGAGPGGRRVANVLAGEGRRVAMIESELVGGECPYWACMPTKALLRPVEARAEGNRVPGLDVPPPAWNEVREYRDYMVSGLDDSSKAQALQDKGVELVREHGRIAGPGRVEAGDRVLETDVIAVATGTTSAIPPIDGLDEVDYWTNREATTLKEIPASAVVLGGGPVGIELAQFLARFGCQTTLVEAAGRLLAREEPRVSELLAELLPEERLTLRLDSEAVRAEPGVKVTLGSGEEIAAERLVVAVGRAPRVEGIGLETVGIEPGERGIDVDERCRAAEGVWAVGDVTGAAPFTHVAAYQGRVAAADILGRDARADLRAVPRVVFSDPEVAAVGLTAEQARDQGLDVVAAEVDLSDVDRTETYGRGVRGSMGVLADRRRRILVGAWAVGPMAGEWIHSLVLAVKAEVTVDTLRDTMLQFPTFSESVLSAAQRLEL